MAVPRLVIVGGGTAGWLAAYIIGDTARRRKTPLDVTVLEPSSIPTIGVGEGTTAIFKTFLEAYGLDEREFLRETEGTIKFGIRHRDWRAVGHTYDGPIDDPHALAPRLGHPEYLNLLAVATGRPVSEIHLFGQLMGANKSPYGRNSDGRLVRVGPHQHAYHIDNALVGKYLRKRAADVEVIDGVVASVEKHAEGGAIETLVLEDGRRVAGDFFVDCSGFRRLLIDKELGGGWVDYGTELPVNRALPFFLAHDEDHDIGPYTVAWARDAGWMWQIPTQSRLGCGYVYCDEFVSPEQARAEIEEVLGQEIEPRADIRFKVGRVARPWTANCLATGLAAGFLEPLEATSIHSTLVQLMLFAQDYLRAPFRFRVGAADDYNQRIGQQFDDYRTFLNLHYRGQRNDTPFWQHVHASCSHETTQQRLAGWVDRMPQPGDFPQFLSGLPHAETQLYVPVLDGLGFLDPAVARRELAKQPGLRAKAQRVTAELKREHTRVAKLAMGHRAYLQTPD